MDWPAYVQRLLYESQGPMSLTGGPVGPQLLMALQRFLIENSYAISMARQGGQIAQDVAGQQAEQAVATLSNIPGIGGLAGQVASAQTMSNAQAEADAMLAAASGQADWTTQTAPGGWDPMRQQLGGM